MALEAISLKPNQDIREISFEAADNGGAVINFVIYTPALGNRDSIWDRRTEVFAENEIETTAVNRIVELYKADMKNKLAKKKQEAAAPVKSGMVGI